MLSGEDKWGKTLPKGRGVNSFMGHDLALATYRILVTITKLKAEFTKPQSPEIIQALTIHALNRF
jgi:hypothetical protein